MELYEIGHMCVEFIRNCEVFFYGINLLVLGIGNSRYTNTDQ